MSTNCTVQAQTRSLGGTTADAAWGEAHSANEDRRSALVRREWARTGEHGWRETPKFSSLCGWWVIPGMVMEAKYSAKVGALGLGDVRVVGMPQQLGRYASAPWGILVESIETGARGVFVTYSYDSHDCHVSAPSYMLWSDTFHAVRNGSVSFAHERFDIN